MAFPISPTSGTTHGVNGRVWSFNGYAWDRLDLVGGTGTSTSTSSGNRFTFGLTAPVGSTNGDFWMDSSNAALYVYVNDTNTEQWVDIAGGIIGPTGSRGNTGSTGSQGIQGPTGTPGSGVAGNNDIGVMYLKGNTFETTIPFINAREIVVGGMTTGTLYNFQKHSTTNSLQYLGTGGKFHVIATFDFQTEVSNNTCGFYIGKNTDISSGLSANADRISESEVYIHSSSSSKPVAGALQTIVDLNTNDRLFFIVQNKDAAKYILVEFLKFIAVPLTSERGATGNTGPQGNTGNTGNTGPQGNTGATGADGLPGSEGIQGPKGNTGNTGNTGVGYTAIGLSGGFLWVSTLDSFGIRGASFSIGYVQGATGSSGIQGPTGYRNYTIGLTAPSGATDGDAWLDTATGIEFTFINDGDTTQWVEL